MINEDVVIAALGRTDVYKYGTNYDFEAPAAFVQVSTEKANSFAYSTTVEVSVVFDTEERFNGFMDSFDSIFRPQGYIENWYIYRAGKNIDGEELLPNGFHSRKVTYTLLIEEVQ